MQRKYTLDLLSEAGMLACKLVEISMDPKTNIMKVEEAGSINPNIES